MPEPVKDVARVFAYLIAALVILAAAAFLVGQSACAFRFAAPDFCTQDAIVSRRQFFLEVLAASGALWGALVLIGRS